MTVLDLHKLNCHIATDQILERHIANAVTRSRIVLFTLEDDVFAVDAFDQTTMVQDEAVQNKHKLTTILLMKR